MEKTSFRIIVSLLLMTFGLPMLAQNAQEIYNSGIREMKKGTVAGYENAIDLFKKAKKINSSFTDNCNEQTNACNKRMRILKAEAQKRYENGVSLLESGNCRDAKEEFVSAKRYNYHIANRCNRMIREVEECIDNLPPSSNPFYTLTFEAEGGTKYVEKGDDLKFEKRIGGNQFDGYTGKVVVIPHEWLDYKIEDGRLMVTCKRNESAKEREVRPTILQDRQPIGEVRIIQSGSQPFLKIDFVRVDGKYVNPLRQVKLPNSKGKHNVVIGVKSNTDFTWEYDGASNWLKLRLKQVDYKYLKPSFLEKVKKFLGIRVEWEKTEVYEDELSLEWTSDGGLQSDISGKIILSGNGTIAEIEVINR